MNHNGNEPETVGLLSKEHIDIIGEVSNISMGSAATALSNIIGKKVTITSPHVEIGSQESIRKIEEIPSVGVIISYTKGLIGKNFLILRVADALKIVKVLMGDALPEEEEFGEFHLSAVGEVMNQMMGSSSTALAGFIGRQVNISPPTAFMITEDNKKDRLQFIYDNINENILVKFLFSVEDMLESELYVIMPKDFSMELVNAMMANMGMDIPGQEVPEPAQPPAAPQQAPPQSVQRQAPPPPAPEKVPLARKPEREETASDEAAAWQTAAAPVTRSARRTAVRPAVLPSFDEPAPKHNENESLANFDLIQDVPLELSVEVGRARKRVKEILDFSVGSIIELDKQAGDPVDIIVNGQLIAHGEVVVIDESFGVRVTEIVRKKR